MLARFRFTLLLLFIAVMLGVAVLALDLLAQKDLRSLSSIPSHFADLGHTLRSWDSILTFVRLTLLGGLFLGWGKLIHGLTSLRVLTQVDAASLSSYRVRIFVWLLAIELLIGQRLLQHVVEFLASWL